MFLRITALLMLLLLPFYGESSLIATDRYEQKDAETDFGILKSILSRNTDDLTTLKRLIDITFTLEYFDQTERYCEQYLSIQKNSDAAYLKILAAASLGNFKTAADQIDPFISEYKNLNSARDITILKYRKNIYSKSTDTRGFPSGAVKSSWGIDSLIKTIIPRDSILTGYNFTDHNHTVFKIQGNTAGRINTYPDYLSGIPEDSINSISLSDDGREVLVSSSSGDSSTIYIRSYQPDKKSWSRWENLSELNPGTWNHYPNFINNNAVVFSSSTLSDESDYDIYISLRNENGNWSRAEKLQGINTPLDEISIWVHPDEETIYFSSNGYAGMGGFDIYGAHLIKKKNSFEVTGITNISSANTFRNEKYPLFVTPSGGASYFNFREGKKHNIFSCIDISIKPVPVFFYNADIVDDATGTPVNGVVTAELKSSDPEFSFSRPVYSDGFTGTTLRRNLKYTLTLSAQGYEPFSKTILFTGENDLIADKIRMKIKSEKPVRPGIITLIASMKLIDCDKTKSIPLQKILEKDIGVLSQNAVRGKNILSADVCGDLRCAVIEGKAVDADFVVFGTLAETKQSAMKTLGNAGEDQYLAKRVTGTTYTLELKLLDTVSGKVIVTFKKTTGNPDSLKKITSEFIKKTESFYNTRP